MSTHLLPRLERFLARPWGERRQILSQKLRHTVRQASYAIPKLTKMEPGFWFVVWNDAVREAVLSDEFEKIERQFVQRYLKNGMTMLDVGAYFGIYSLTASMKVGRQGHVVAFEPADSQFRKLRWNLSLNRCSNVRTEKLALSDAEGLAKFFVPIDGAEGFSGLRRPEVGVSIRCLDVRTARLDDYLERRGIAAVDLIKVDVEGGELDFFKGARKLLTQRSAPVILCELQDIRSKSWGHSARQTATFVQEFGYRWFRPVLGGSIAAMPVDPASYEGNFIAVPATRVECMKEMIQDESELPH